MCLYLNHTPDSFLFKLNSLAEDSAPNVTNKVLYLKNIKLADNLPDTILTFIAEVNRKSLTVYEVVSLLEIPTADQTIIYKELLKKFSSDPQIQLKLKLSQTHYAKVQELLTVIKILHEYATTLKSHLTAIKAANIYDMTPRKVPDKSGNGQPTTQPGGNTGKRNRYQGKSNDSSPTTPPSCFKCGDLSHHTTTCKVSNPTAAQTAAGTNNTEIALNSHQSCQHLRSQPKGHA